MSVHEVAAILVSQIARETIRGIEDGLRAAAEFAFTKTQDLADGHASNGLGYARNLYMNEAFRDSLQAAGADPAPLSGCSIVTGRIGCATLARCNYSGLSWDNMRRSVLRRQLARANWAAEGLLQNDLFSGDATPVSEISVFFVAQFSGSLRVSPSAPLSVIIAVPDRHMRNWLLWESTVDFLARYEPQVVQQDHAMPSLKQHKKKGTQE